MSSISLPRKIIVTSIFTAIFTLSGCQSTSEPDKFVDLQQQTQERNKQFLISKTAIEELAKRFKDAEEANLYYFSAELFKKAKNEQEDADEKFNDIRFSPHKATSSKTQSILLDVTSANQYLDRVYLIKEAAEQILAKSFTQIKILKALNADKLYAKEYAKSQEKLADLIELISEGKQAEAQEQQSKILPLLTAIEIKVVKETELGELQKLLISLKNSKINTIAPISYQKAIGLAQSAEAVISTNPRDLIAIRESVALATFEAKHTQNIAIEVRNLLAIKTVNYERHILDFENKLNSVSQALKGIDLRDKVLSEQTTSLVIQGEELNAQVQQQADNIATLELSIATKKKLLLAAATDKDSFSTMIQAKLVEREKQIEQQKVQLNALTEQKKSLEHQLTAARQENNLAKQNLDQMASQHEIALAKNELASSTNSLSIEKKQLTLEKDIQLLQAELAKAKKNNLKLIQESAQLSETISEVNKKKVTLEEKVPASAEQ